MTQRTTECKHKSAQKCGKWTRGNASRSCPDAEARCRRWRTASAGRIRPWCGRSSRTASTARSGTDAPTGSARASVPQRMSPPRVHRFGAHCPKVFGGVRERAVYGWLNGGQPAATPQVNCQTLSLNLRLVPQTTLHASCGETAYAPSWRRTKRFTSIGAPQAFETPSRYFSTVRSPFAT